MKPINLSSLRKMKQAGEKFTCLTAYDFTFAHVLDGCGVEVLLVGDSLGMVIQGQPTTVPVTVDDMIYHTKAVSRGNRNALIITDMPFLSHTSPAEALNNAGRIMREGAHIVKLEGGAYLVETVQELSKFGIPVCAHLGLQPQSVHKLGGYKIQGRSEDDAEKMLEEAKLLQEAGADLMLLECVPADLAEKITKILHIPVIGIGAGPHCDGQVLVLHDVLGITADIKPRFVKNFMQGQESIQAAIQAYVKAVKNGDYPSEEHSF
ncbi:MAG: 3-methyl-2-oxobutanoate hydroxymethyltransferase [Gammaproteobacteria bacterium]|jgi:3-methyl-2-oxobutanoate hydroxymethyltransferase|nr:3-methyl-2-oxobutanoate hydroxymethyltransferase [Gammaproteobacteria bacterium]